MKRKQTTTTIILMVLMLLLTACSPNKPEVLETEEILETLETEESLAVQTITDREGNSFTLPQEVDSIISMAPSITETLVHLGLSDKIVATDKYSNKVEGLPENLPIFEMMTPDTESMTALQPDIVFATGMSKVGGDDPFKPLTDMGVIMTYIPSSNSIEGIKEDLRFIGTVVGEEEKTEEIIKEMEMKMDEIISKITMPEEKKTVYFEIAAAPDLYSFGTGTFLNEMLEMLGAENILADQEGWISISEEVVLEKNPDIIFTNINYIEDPIGEIMGRSGWDVVNAVKEQQVYSIDADASTRSNENIVEAFLQIAEALYPEAFSK